MNIELSSLDEEHFGFRTARAVDVSAASLPDVLAYCHDHRVQFLIARAPVTELAAVQAMEQAGFLLMDTLMYAGCDVTTRPIPADDQARAALRPYRSGDEAAIQAVAAAAFQDYGGHYHADERLDRARCDAVYESWAINSCRSKDLADVVLVAEQAGKIVGFTTLLLNPAGDEGDIRLFAVAPWAQRQGIARSLMIGAMVWCRDQGAARTIISTQITNFAMRKVWSRLGFEPLTAIYTLHKWFDGVT